MRNLILGLFLMLTISSAALSQSNDTKNKSVSTVKSQKVITKTALVFVQKADSTWEPRMIQVGISDYDYTEVISGLKEGERVAMLSAAMMQAQRAAANAAMSQRLGTSSPLGVAPTKP